MSTLHPAHRALARLLAEQAVRDYLTQVRESDQRHSRERPKRVVQPIRKAG